MSAALIDALIAALGDSAVVTDAGDLAPHLTEERGFTPAPPRPWLNRRTPIKSLKS